MFQAVYVGIACQLAHKHDIVLDLLKIVLMWFYCDYVSYILPYNCDILCLVLSFK